MSLDGGVAYVVAPRAGKAWVVTEDGQRVLARNHLNLRVPPGSKVVLARDEQGKHRIVGRER